MSVCSITTASLMEGMLHDAKIVGAYIKPFIKDTDLYNDCKEKIIQENNNNVRISNNGNNQSKWIIK